MSIINVLNVGQGDSIMIKPKDICKSFCKCKYTYKGTCNRKCKHRYDLEFNCKYKCGCNCELENTCSCKYNHDYPVICDEQNCELLERTIFVDLGPEYGTDISQYVENEDIDIFITHFHSDHLKGIHYLLNNKLKQIKEIFIPLYQNEITLIATFIKKLKKIKEIPEDNEFLLDLQDIVENQKNFKEELERKGAPYLLFAYEAFSYCSHIKCLNPPRIIKRQESADKETNKKLSEDTLANELSELFVPECKEILTTFLNTDINPSYQSILENTFTTEFFLAPHKQRNFPDESYENRYNFVYNFLVDNFSYFKEFNEKPSTENFSKIYDNFVKHMHDACLVLMARYNGHKILLTGDASEKVFNRLIEEKIDIRADYLKVPHHGSKGNLNKEILSAINPSVAIISHKNGHFGKATDTHPNFEVLTLLDPKLNPDFSTILNPKLNPKTIPDFDKDPEYKPIKILITNDVEKEINGKKVTYIKKENYNQAPDDFVTIL